MNLWLPSALAFLALGPLIILLHLLRPRRLRVVVPSLLAWMPRSGETRSKPGFGLLRRWLALLLSLAIFLLLVLALAQPDAGKWFRPAPTVLVIDVRARMHAKSADGQSAFDRARSIARSYAARANAGRPVALVTCPDAGLLPFQTHPSALLNAIDELQPTDATGDLPAAMDLASAALAAHGEGGQVVVITDRPVDGVKNPGVVIHAVGEQAENLAVTAMDARRTSTGTTTVFFSVRNASDRDVPMQAAMRLDGRLVDAVTASLPPDAEQGFLVDLPEANLRQATRGELSVTLENQNDAIAPDDVAQALVPVGERPRILLVSAGNEVLENALAADQTIAFELLPPDAWQPTFSAGFVAVIFDDWPSAPQDLDANALYLGRSPWTKPDEIVTNPVVTDVDRRSPIIRDTKWDALRIREAHRFRPPDTAGWAPVVSSGEDVLIAIKQDPSEPSKRAVVVAFDISKSDLPARVAFPLMVSNSVHWLANDAIPAARTAGRNAPLKAGFSAHAGMPIAVNPAAADEADVRPASRTEPVNFSTAEAAIPAHLWQFLAGIALVLIVFDWAAYHRRWIA